MGCNAPHPPNSAQTRVRRLLGARFARGGLRGLPDWVCPWGCLAATRAFLAGFPTTGNPDLAEQASHRRVQEDQHGNRPTGGIYGRYWLTKSRYPLRPPCRDQRGHLLPPSLPRFAVSPRSEFRVLYQQRVSALPRRAEPPLPTRALRLRTSVNQLLTV
jgi:hypothetical protein